MPTAEPTTSVATTAASAATAPDRLVPATTEPTETTLLGSSPECTETALGGSRADNADLAADRDLLLMGPELRSDVASLGLATCDE